MTSDPDQEYMYNIYFVWSATPTAAFNIYQFNAYKNPCPVLILQTLSASLNLE